MTFHWHSPWLYLLLLVNPIVYVIAALSVRRSARLEMSLCADHERIRSHFFALGCASILPPVIGYLLGSGGALAVGLGGMVLMGIVGIWRTRSLRPLRVDDAQSRFAGAGEAFLASLPNRK